MPGPPHGGGNRPIQHISGTTALRVVNSRWRRAALRCLAPSPRIDTARVARPCTAGDFAAVQKQHECWNAANAVASRQRLLLLGVDFQEPVIGFELGGPLARKRAPWRGTDRTGRPEIYDHGMSLRVFVALDGYGIGRDRLPREQLVLAGSTLGLPRRPVFGDPVDGAAMKGRQREGLIRSS